MKKFFSILLVLGALLTQGLTSCSKSTPDLINEYKEAVKEELEAKGRGDSNAAQKASEKASKIANELRDRKLTPQEEQQMRDAAMEISNTVITVGSQMMNDAVDQASEQMNDYSAEPIMNETETEEPAEY